jgi:hypothetical protein
LASGADQVFGELVLSLGGELRVIVPSGNYASTFESDRARIRYEQLLAAAASVEWLQFDRPSEEAFLAAGMSVARNSEEVIAIWDGEPAAGIGGTADIVLFARSIGVPVVVIW